MNRLMLGMGAVLLACAMVVPDADAARMGGGRSIGAQRSMTAVAPARSAQQGQPSAPAKQASAVPAAQPQPASGLGRWAPLLGGLAVGGLAGALLGGSGFGSMLVGWLMVAVLAIAVVSLIRALAQRRGSGAQPLQYAAGGGSGAYPLGNETVAAPPPSQAAGFDARPMAPAAPAVPAGFDAAAFLRAAKLNFMKLQLANDAGNLDELREFTTPDLYEALKRDVLARGGSRQQTDVLSLNADLLEVATEGDRHWASVRFSGQVRESSAVAPEAFEEVWNLAKPVNDSTGWLLAGIQQMH